MKNKKVLFVTLLASICLLGSIIPSAAALTKANEPNIQKTLSTDISPTKPGKGATVSFLPDALAKLWQMNDLVNTYSSQTAEIGELTPYCDDLTSWVNYLDYVSEENKAIRRSYFDKYDMFRPTNNILAWDSSIDAKEYRIIISQDKSFGRIEREYVVSGSDNSVIFENPYTGVEYYWQVIATKNDNSKVYSDIFNFTVANYPRTVFIDGVSNTRDLGGYVGLNNKRTKQGLIYRGMGLEAISSEGVDEFKNKLGIKTEIDLRNVGEGLENYVSLNNYHHFPSPYEYTSTQFSTPNPIGIEYFGDGSLVPNFGNAIKVLADKNNYPVYFHCAVGRDRTGWFGLCVNFLCGVSEEVALKEFILSFFSTSGAGVKGNVDFYNRFINIRNYLNTYEGANLSEKTENYLIAHTSVTHEDCENIRKILLGDVEVPFEPGTVNPDAYTDFAKVTFRKYGETPIIKMVEKGSLLEDPDIATGGAWYNGDTVWDFAHDTVTEDICLDYLVTNKCKVAVHYSGINLPDDALDVPYHTELDLSIFEKDGYTYKVYDDVFNEVVSCVVDSDITLNVVYTPVGGYIPKSNSRIIVMAGQSNGAGVAHYQYLEQSVDEAKIKEINDGYSNVLLMGYSHTDYINDFRVVSANKKSATAGAPGTFGFEVGLADRLSKAFPDETTYILKYAHGGTSLNYDWLPTSCRDLDIYVPYDDTYEKGWLYDGMVESLTDAIQKISERTNTIPMVEAFMWMQGENDASYEAALDLYLHTFNSLLDDFTTTFKDNISYKFAVYDAGICETSLWPLAKQMNGIKRSRVDEHNVYIDTVSRLTTSFEPIGESTDAAHYDAACYIDLGHMFADAYLEKTLKGYTHDALEIEAPTKITMIKDQKYTLDTPTVLFNGTPVTAKMSYFAEQHTGFTNYVYSYFTVNNDGSFTPTRLGESQLRITAYYHNEVRTVLVPVEVISE